MAAVLFEEGIDILFGAGNFSSDTVKAYAVDSTYTPTAADTMSTFTTAAADIGTAQTLAGKSITDGKLSANDPTWTDILDGDNNIVAVVFTITVSAVEYLLYYDDTADLNPDGNDVTYQINATYGIWTAALATP